MRRCESCARSYPEVVGTQTQVCPHCGHETEPVAEAARDVRDEPARVDPTAATGEGLRLFARHYPRLLLLWLPVLLLEVPAFLALRLYERSLDLPADLAQLQSLPTGVQMRYLGVALPLLFVLYWARLSAWGWIARFVGDRMGERATSRPQAALVAAYAGLGLVLALLYGVGLVLLVVPFLVFLHWFLFAPAALAGGASGIAEALKRSRRFARERRTYGFTALVVLLWIAIALVASLLGALVSGILASARVPEDLAASIAGPLGGWFVAPLVPVLPAAFWFLAQRSAAQESAAVAVDPAAPAASRFRTTKCPQCATLVPYTATGSPVEVTCPVCGRSGRVL